MSRKSENTGFTCSHCGKPVVALTNGSYRNHCPFACILCMWINHPVTEHANVLGKWNRLKLYITAKRDTKLSTYVRNVALKG